MNKHKLGKQLGDINVPEQLENRIHRNWQQQLREESIARAGSKWQLATTASFLVVIVLLRTVFSTPDLVNAALEDIVADAKHSVGVSVEMDSILQANHIQAPTINMPVRMTKYCTLEKSRTLHMQIAGEQQGSVHLFVKENGFDAQFWQDSQGVKQQMIWKIIHPRDDLSVLVIHTPDMDPLNVDKLVQHMFFS